MPKFGGGLMLRDISGYLRPYDAGLFGFFTLDAFAAGVPSTVAVGAGAACQAFQPAAGFRAVVWQPAILRVRAGQLSRTQTCAPNYGVRYESFGTPANNGPVKDMLLTLGAGSSLPERLRTADFAALPPGDQSLYSRTGITGPAVSDLCGEPPDAAVRSWCVAHTASSIDRPYDNLFENVRNNDFPPGTAVP